MNTDQKISALNILARMPFKNKGEREAQKMLINSLKTELIPKEQLPLKLTEVYRDNPHIQTTHKTWPEVMNRIKAVEKKEKLVAIHVTREGEPQPIYTWKV